MTRLITGSATFSTWLADRRAFVQAVHGDRFHTLIVAGSAVNLPHSGPDRLDLPGVKHLRVSLCSPSDRGFLARLAAAARRAEVSFTADHVLLGEAAVHDRLRGRLPTFDETYRSIALLRKEGIAATVTVPLWPSPPTRTAGS